METKAIVINFHKAILEKYNNGTLELEQGKSFPKAVFDAIEAQSLDQGSEIKELESWILG
jgi:hypothetical protein